MNSEKNKNMVFKIFRPGIVVTFSAVFISAGLLYFVFANGYDSHPLAPVVYVISAYTLTCVCFYIPLLVRKIKNKFYGNKYGNRIVTDPVYRTLISVICMLAFNFLYSVLNFVLGKVYGSFWWGVQGLYYFVLSVANISVLLYMLRHREDVRKGLKAYRLCGILIIFLSIVYFALAYMIVVYNNGAVYHGTMIFVAALYTFVCLTVALVNIVKYRKYNNPILSASKAVRTTAALVSLVMLQTAMLSAFGSGRQDNFARDMNILTGSAVGLIILSMGIYMTVKSSKKLKSIASGAAEAKADRSDG